MSTFIINSEDIPDPLFGGGDQVTPSLNEVFVYIGKEDFVRFHGDRVVAARAKGSKRYRLTLGEQAVSVTTKVLLPVGSGDATANLQATASLIKDRNELFTYLAKKVDTESVVQDALTKIVSELARDSMLKLDNDKHSVVPAIVSMIATFGIDLTSVTFELVYSEEAKSRVLFERNREAIEIQLRSLGIYDQYHARLVASTTTQELEKIRIEISHTHDRNAKSTEIAEICRALVEEISELSINALRRPFRLKAEQRVILNRSSDADALGELKEELIILRDAFELAEKCQSEGLMVPEAMVSAALTMGDESTFDDLKSYVRQLGQNAQLNDLIAGAPEHFRKVILMSLPTEFRSQGGHLILALKAVMVHLIGPQAEGQGLYDMFKLLPREALDRPFDRQDFVPPQLSWNPDRHLDDA